jgi:acetyl esterase/lipase
MKIPAVLFAAFIALASGAFAADEFPLWPQGAPGALGTAAKDIPTLTYFPADPKTASGATLVICPGGAYAKLAEHEGRGYAEFFSKNGVACFVLKYRLGSDGYRHPRMLEDAARAVRLVRAKAADWKIDPHRIGIIGSSAGGHLASTLATHFDAGNPAAPDPIDRESSRPDLAILCYAVISMGDNAHSGSRKNLLGDNPSPELVRSLSNELQVTPQTPPCFIWHTFEDPVVKVENSLDFAAALKKAGVPFDLHIYQKGGHGLGLGKNLPPGQHLPWADDCIYWLKAQNFVKQDTTP